MGCRLVQPERYLVGMAGKAFGKHSLDDHSVVVRPHTPTVVGKRVERSRRSSERAHPVGRQQIGFA